METTLQTVKKYIKISMGFKPNYDLPQDKVYNLSNHLYMAAIALSRLGASDEQVEKFGQYYVDSLPLVKTKKDFQKDLINEENFEQYLGDYDKYEEYLSYFQKYYEEKNKDIKAVIADQMPRLSSGIGAEAFHCLIQLGYAIDWEMDAEEILQALAYMALQNCRIFPTELNPEKKDAFKTLQELKEIKPYLKSLVTLDYPTNIVQKMNIIAKDEKFQSIIPKEIEITENLIDDLQLAMLKLFVETDNFIVLHAVSGVTCLRQLLPHIHEQDKPKIINDTMRHLYAGYGASLFVHQSEEEIQKSLVIPEDLPSWEEIIKKANDSSDDHDIKFVYICNLEAKHYGFESEHGKYARYAAHKRMSVNNSKF